jgi:hypothetical protein
METKIMRVVQQGDVLTVQSPKSSSALPYLPNNHADDDLYHAV